MLEKLDNWRLGKIERFAHRWQKTFGQDCFWWARVCLFLSSMCVSFALIWAWNQYKIHVFFGLTGLLLSLLFTQIFIWPNIIRFYEHAARAAQRKGCANPLKLSYQLARLEGVLVYCLVAPFLLFLFHMGILGTPANLVFITSSIASFIMHFVECFMSCDLLPPSKSKVRKWLENKIAQTKQIFSPQPVPVPVPVKIKAPWF